MRLNLILAFGSVAVGFAVAAKIVTSAGELIGNLILHGFESALRAEFYAASGAFKFVAIFEVTGLVIGVLICLGSFFLGLYFFTKND